MSSTTETVVTAAESVKAGASAERHDSRPQAAPSRASLPPTSPPARRAAKKRVRLVQLLAEHALLTSHKDLAWTVLALQNVSPEGDPAHVVALLADAGEMLAREIAHDLSQLMETEPSPYMAGVWTEDAARGARLVLLVADAIAATTQARPGLKRAA